MNLFKKLESWLPAMETKLGSVAVTYTRGADSLPLTAVVGTVKRVADDAGAVDRAKVLHGERCYLIAVADLTFGEPKRGDRIAETIDGVEYVFEVQSPSATRLGAPEPAWRHSGPDRVTWRIWAKRVS